MMLLIGGKDGGIVVWVMEHSRVIISSRNIWPLWFCWDVKWPPGEQSTNEDGLVFRVHLD